MADERILIDVPALPIPLGAFLKLTGLFETGGAAKIFIQQGRVAVNGVVETHRRHSLSDGDTVVFAEKAFIVRNSGG